MDREFYAVQQKIARMEDKKPRKVTLVNKVLTELETLEVGDELDKISLIRKLWRMDVDYFVIRSFDVAYHKSKQLIPEKTFRTAGKIITRLK